MSIYATKEQIRNKLIEVNPLIPMVDGDGNIVQRKWLSELGEEALQNMTITLLKARCTITELDTHIPKPPCTKHEADVFGIEVMAQGFQIGTNSPKIFTGYGGVQAYIEQCKNEVNNIWKQVEEDGVYPNELDEEAFTQAVKDIMEETND